MDSAVIHTRMTDSTLDITVHSCPRKLFESLNVAQKGSGMTIWKVLDEGGLKMTFFFRQEDKSGA